MRFLIIDDCPSRYDEFTKILDRKGDSWVISYDEETVMTLLNYTHFDVILLDHDMPVHDGRWWANLLAIMKNNVDITKNNINIPVIITSTTGLEGVREEMLNTFKLGGIRAIMNPADHIGCEAEWYWWAKGVVGEE